MLISNRACRGGGGALEAQKSHVHNTLSGLQKAGSCSAGGQLFNTTVSRTWPTLLVPLPPTNTWCQHHTHGVSLNPHRQADSREMPRSAAVLRMPLAVAVPPSLSKRPQPTGSLTVAPHTPQHRQQGLLCLKPCAQRPAAASGTAAATVCNPHSCGDTRNEQGSRQFMRTGHKCLITVAW